MRTESVSQGGGTKLASSRVKTWHGLFKAQRPCPLIDNLPAVEDLYNRTFTGNADVDPVGGRRRYTYLVLFKYAPGVAGQERLKEILKDYVRFFKNKMSCRSIKVKSMRSPINQEAVVTLEYPMKEYGSLQRGQKIKEKFTKATMIEKLQCLFRQRSNSQLGECYGDLQNIYGEYASYWFAKTYECFEPYWNGKNCRAMGNIFISKPCTTALKQYVDESFTKDSELYYYIDYTVGMQIIDRQTVYIHLDGNKKICLLNTELHKDGKKLYAVIVPNSKSNTRQQWMIPYEHISEAFMTQDGLKAAYGLCPADLPKGAMAKDQSWKIQKNQLEWYLAQREQMTQLIRWYFHGRSKIPIIQSQKKAQNYHNGNIAMTRDEFAHYVIDSFHYALDNDEIVNIAHVDIHQHKYQLESVLPVWLEPCQAYVGLIFSFDKEAGIIINGVNLDLVDLKNKARLVGPVAADSWLNNRQIAINRLKLAHGPWYTQDMPSSPSSRSVSSGWSSMGYTPSPSPPSPNYSVSSQKLNVAYCNQTNQMLNYQNNCAVFYNQHKRGQSVC